MSARETDPRQVVIVVGLSALCAGALVARSTDSLVASGSTTFVVAVLLATLLRKYVETWASEKYLENPGYRVLVSQHYARLRLAPVFLPILAAFLAWYAYVENSMLAALGAGLAAGLSILFLIMKSAFEVKAI